MSAGLLTTEQAMDSDAGAALAAYIAYMTRIAGRIRSQQKLRVQQWQRHQAEQRRTGHLLSLTPDLARGVGARLDALTRTTKRAQLLEMTLRVFEGRWGKIAEGRMPTTAVVEDLDEVKERGPSIGMRAKGRQPEQLAFERREEAFCQGVVVTVSN